MTKSTMTAFLFSTSMGVALLAAPVAAQDAAAPAEAAEPAPLTAEQIDAQNKAIRDFGEAQALQTAGDHAGALAKLDGAMPVIRNIAARDPANVQSVGFLASALTMAATSHGALGNNDQIAAHYEEAIPAWRAVYAADNSQVAVRNTLVSLLVNLGNYNLIQENKDAAKPLFDEALMTAKTSLQNDPTSPEMANAHFSALVGLNQSTGEMSYLDDAKAVGTELRAKGIVNALNEPSVNALLPPAA